MSRHPKTQKHPGLNADLRLLLEARHHDPFSVLGRHSADAGEDRVRVFIPGARQAAIESAAGELALTRVADTDIFEWQGASGLTPLRYQVNWQDAQNITRRAVDPYCFPPQLSDYDLHLFGEGKHWHAYRFLGAHVHEADGVNGVLFAVWAPEAERVSVVGDFNQWDGRRHPMRILGGSGVWELFVPGLGSGTLYKFELRHRASGTLHLKSDPYAQRFELRPGTASIVAAPDSYVWRDGSWLTARAQADWLHQPLSIYEAHLGSWQRDAEGGFLNYRELAHRLVEHVSRLGFTHIELLPVTEHPFDASWGYQTTGYYAPTSRFGTPDDFRYFVDYCHRHGIGVLLDWVPGHFPKDTFALARFDGSALYEHEDPRRGEHRDWGTLIFNYGRNEVKNFLLASAVYWLEEFHLDGLRVDAVASMLYLDYSRAPGDWYPNIHGGRENLEAIAFMRELNSVTHGAHPGTLMMAEESTAWPMVSRPVSHGGLGFSMKWNMGWMHDTLQYMSLDPVYRKHHHDRLSFGMLYAFTENFILPFSHDEVVHGKASMHYKMPGDEWQRLANLRLLYTYMYTYPGKKLLFMGAEFAQGREWDHTQALDWYVLDYAPHRGVQNLVADLNRLYREASALHCYEFDWRGFEWIECHDATQSVLSYLRKSEQQTLVVALNFTPVPRHKYRLGVPHPGYYRVILNSDSAFYGGGNLGQAGADAHHAPWMGRPYSIVIDLRPWRGLF
ncbi:MAG: 1,4-alpha-glucan branching protein GlgB [Gammaproteobacteria bacterium]|nr:1,4-alpha-glucan branching protein GlgB [Gammaproteobacteria bacterium]